MKTRRSILMVTIVLLAALLTGAVILAQTETPTVEPTSPVSSFTDGRINGDIDLGGLAIYCTDQTGNTHVNTFQNGAITVWGVGGQEYIVLTADQLRGSVEIPQPPPTMEANVTEAPTVVVVTPEVTEMAGTEEAAMTPTAPVLLARAATPSGEIWFFGLGDDNFMLQGTDNTGKFYSYMWNGCSIGSIQAGAVPIFTEVPNAPSSPAATSMPTAESTAAATTSP